MIEHFSNLNYKPFYIYNIEQANFFMLNGIVAIGTGFGKQGDLYIKFPRDFKSEEVFDRWCTLNGKTKDK